MSWYTAWSATAGTTSALAHARSGCSQGRPRLQRLLPRGPRDGGRRRVRPDALGWEEQGHNQKRREPVSPREAGRHVRRSKKRFLTVKTFEDLRDVLAEGEAQSVDKVVSVSSRCASGTLGAEHEVQCRQFCFGTYPALAGRRAPIRGIARSALSQSQSTELAVLPSLITHRRARVPRTR